MLKKAKDNLNAKNKNFLRGQVIAELNLGFWVGLFKKKYKPEIWNKAGVFENVFPYFDFKTANRIGFIHPKLKQIKTIRNRISHQEPLLNYSVSLDIFYSELITVLNWLSPDVKNLLPEICRFDEIWINNKDKINQFKQK